MAFWRWSGRSRQHKKGAWCLGRFLSLDPDRRSIWVQVNNTTVKIANNQVRSACGWEEWTPSAQNIAILKDAEGNLRDNLWEYGVEEPPGDQQLLASDLEAQPARPPPLPPPGRDYWRYDGAKVIRMHVTPRRDVYVPDSADCEFDIAELSDTRITYINDILEQPEED